MEDNIDKNSKKYSKIREYLSIANIIYEIIFLLIMIFFLSDIFSFWAGEITTIRYFKISIYSFLFLIFHAIFNLPLGFYSGYILEHKFKLSTENIFGWLKFQFKGILFSLVLGIPLFVLFYFILDNFQDLWWIIAASCMFIVSLIISYIFPYIISFFYKLIPLDKKELFLKVKDIFQKGGLRLEGLYRIDLGARTKKVNAALTGMGKTKKVLLSDTLLNYSNFYVENPKKDECDRKEQTENLKFTQNEIASITAHEVGHYVHKHIWKLMLLEGFLSYALFYIIYIFSSDIINFMSYGNINDIFNLPVLLLILTFLNLFITPLNNFFSRLFEYQADDYAVSMTDIKTYESSLNKLSEVNLVDKNPPRIIEVLFHSHPSIKHRIQSVK